MSGNLKKIMAEKEKFTKKLILCYVMERSCCSIISENNVATGFLIDVRHITADVNEKYVITCAHVLPSENATTFYAIFQQHNSDETITNIKAQFRVIGYDSYADLMVGYFDTTLPYNKTYNVDISLIPNIVINNTVLNNVIEGDDVYTIGTYDLQTTSTFIKGTISNNTFTQSFRVNEFECGVFPESILINANTRTGMSGSPVWKKDDFGKESLVGMLTGTLFNKMAVAVKSDLLYTGLNTMVNNYLYYNNKFNGDLIKTRQFTNLGLNKCWLGIYGEYFHPNLIFKYKELTNFNYIGGIVISKIVLGYDTAQEEFIFSKNQINNNVVLLNSPLLNTNLYKFVIDTNIVVLKSLSFFNSITAEYDTINLGKYLNQSTYSQFTYGFNLMRSGVATTFDFLGNGGNFLSHLISTYPSLIITYSYLGKDVDNTGQFIWNDATEIIGGNTSDWYSVVKDGDYSFLKHNFTLPIFLRTYLKKLNRTYNDSYSLTHEPVATKSTGLNVGG
jgi:hypothetical protein